MYLGRLGIQGADPDACRAAGGVPRAVYSTYDANRNPIGEPIWLCDFPPNAAKATAPANVTVNTATTATTQVSPQISPSFVQQDQPTGSPVGTNAEQGKTLTEILTALQHQAQTPPVVQVPAYVPVDSTASATDAADSVTIPTPFGPSQVSSELFQKYVPWIAFGIVAVAIWRKKRK